MQQIVIDIHIEIEVGSHLSFDRNLDAKTNPFVGKQLVINRERKGIGNGERLIGGKAGEVDGIVGDGDMFVFGAQDHTHIVHGLVGDIVQGQVHRDRLARVELVVVIALQVVDGISVILDSTQLDGFHSGKHIDTAEAVYVALAFSQTNGSLLKDAAHIGGHQIGVFAQHERHATSRTRRGH